MSTTAPVHAPRRFIIKKGPGLGHVVDAFKYAYSAGPKQGESHGNKPLIPFILIGYWEDEGPVDNAQGGIGFEFQVKGISYDSGTPGSFNLELNLLTESSLRYTKVMGHYNANDGKNRGVLYFS